MATERVNEYLLHSDTNWEEVNTMCETFSTFPSILNNLCVVPSPTDTNESSSCKDENSIHADVFSTLFPLYESGSSKLLDSGTVVSSLDQDIADHVQVPFSVTKSLSCSEDFVCNVCHEDLGDRPKLIQHLKSHVISSTLKDENRRGFMCMLCDSSYSQKYNLKRHLKKIHHVDQEDVSMYIHKVEGKDKAIKEKTRGPGQKVGPPSLSWIPGVEPLKKDTKPRLAPIKSDIRGSKASNNNYLIPVSINTTSNIAVDKASANISDNIINIYKSITNGSIPAPNNNSDTIMQSISTVNNSFNLSTLLKSHNMTTSSNEFIKIDSNAENGMFFDNMMLTSTTAFDSHQQSSEQSTEINNNDSRINSVINNINKTTSTGKIEDITLDRSINSLTSVGKNDTTSTVELFPHTNIINGITYLSNISKNSLISVSSNNNINNENVDSNARINNNNVTHLLSSIFSNNNSSISNTTTTANCRTAWNSNDMNTIVNNSNINNCNNINNHSKINSNFTLNNNNNNNDNNNSHNNKNNISNKSNNTTSSIVRKNNAASFTIVNNNQFSNLVTAVSDENNKTILYKLPLPQPEGRKLTPEEESVCPFCEKQLSTKWSLKRHIDKMHKKVESEGKEGKCTVPKTLEPVQDVQQKPKTINYRHNVLGTMSHNCPICQKQLNGADGKKVSLRAHLRDVHYVDVFGNVQPPTTTDTILGRT